MPYIFAAGAAGVGMLASYLKGKYDAYNAPTEEATPFKLILYIVLGAVGISLLKEIKFLGK